MRYSDGCPLSVRVAGWFPPPPLSLFSLLSSRNSVRLIRSPRHPRFTATTSTNTTCFTRGYVAPSLGARSPRNTLPLWRRTPPRLQRTWRRRITLASGRWRRTESGRTNAQRQTDESAQSAPCICRVCAARACGCQLVSDCERFTSFPHVLKFAGSQPTTP